jgi:hypothetical protein
MPHSDQTGFGKGKISQTRQIYPGWDKDRARSAHANWSAEKTAAAVAVNALAATVAANAVAAVLAAAAAADAGSHEVDAGEEEDDLHELQDVQAEGADDQTNTRRTTRQPGQYSETGKRAAPAATGPRKKKKASASHAAAEPSSETQPRTALALLKNAKGMYIVTSEENSGTPAIKAWNQATNETLTTVRDGRAKNLPPELVIIRNPPELSGQLTHVLPNLMVLYRIATIRSSSHVVVPFKKGSSNGKRWVMRQSNVAHWAAFARDLEDISNRVVRKQLNLEYFQDLCARLALDCHRTSPRFLQRLSRMLTPRRYDAGESECPVTGWPVFNVREAPEASRKAFNDLIHSCTDLLNGKPDGGRAEEAFRLFTTSLPPVAGQAEEEVGASPAHDAASEQSSVASVDDVPYGQSDSEDAMGDEEESPSSSVSEEPGVERLLTDRYRVIPCLDAWLLPAFAANVLHCDPGAVQTQLEANYPRVDATQPIKWARPQWVLGENKYLHMRGNELKREKMWFQLDDPQETKHFLRYSYSGWQWGVLPATSHIGKVPELRDVVARLNAFCVREGYPETNHFIVTRYEDGKHSIGKHYDKPKSIANGSLIVVVKTGTTGRRFRLEWLDGTLIFDKILAPGTAIVMTLEANLRTKHSVPDLAEACGPSGSLVARTITEHFSWDQVEKELRKRGVAIHH